jgi:hypothetical protein
MINIRISIALHAVLGLVRCLAGLVSTRNQASAYRRRWVCKRRHADPRRLRCSLLQVAGGSGRSFSSSSG